MMMLLMLLFKMSMTVGKRVECSHQNGSPEPGHRYAVGECEIRYTCCRSTAAVGFMLLSLCWRLVVERPPVARVSWLRERTTDHAIAPWRGRGGFQDRRT